MTQRPSPEVDLQLWSAVDQYFERSLHGSDPVLEEALSSCRSAGLPEIQVSPLQGKLLHLLARIQGARQILEIGTLGGYSTIWLGRAIPPDGRLCTLELDARHAEVARTNLARAELSDRVEVCVGPALETLPRLFEEGRGPFDLTFIDADKAEYPDYLRWAHRLSTKGSVIVVDNVVRRGDVATEDSFDPSVRGVRMMNEMIGKDSRLSATVVQTVGRKGYDGFTLVIVLAEA